MLYEIRYHPRYCNFCNKCCFFAGFTGCITVKWCHFLNLLSECTCSYTCVYSLNHYISNTDDYWSTMSLCYFFVKVLVVIPTILLHNPYWFWTYLAENIVLFYRPVLIFIQGFEEDLKISMFISYIMIRPKNITLTQHCLANNGLSNLKIIFICSCSVWQFRFLFLDYTCHSTNLSIVLKI